MRRRGIWIGSLVVVVILGGLGQRRGFAQGAAATQSDVKRTIEALGGVKATDQAVREVILKALIDLHSPEAIPQLQGYLSAGNPLSMRLETIRALGSLRSPAAVDSLGALLSDQQTVIRDTVIRALQEIGGQAATTLVAGALKDTDAGVRRSALQVLPQLGARLTNAELTQLMQDKDEKVRGAALDAAGYVGQPRLTADSAGLIRLGLKDASAGVQVKAMHLFVISAAKGITFSEIASFVASDNAAMLPEAYAAIAHFPTAETMDLVKKGMDSPDAGVRSAATRSLAYLPLSLSKPQVEKLLKSDDAVMRTMGMFILVSSNTPDSDVMIHALARDAHSPLAPRAILEMWSRKMRAEFADLPEVLGPVYEAAGPEDKARLIPVAASYADAGGEKLLMEGLVDKDARVRLSVVESLGSVKADLAVKIAEAAVKDPEAAVRLRAAISMQWGGSDKYPTLLEGLTHDADAKVAAMARQILQGMKPANGPAPAAGTGN